jgi:RimJ/RimL family protein N-acetyltransferase
MLRPPAEHDLDDLASLGADPEVMRYIADGKTQTREEAARWLEAMLREGRESVPGPAGLPGWLVITDKADGAWAGLAVLKLMNARHAEALGGGPYVEVGYRLPRAHWGKGYATEAATALVQYGFDALELPLIAAIARAANVASNRVIRKAGLVYRRSYTLDGIDVHFHSLGLAESCFRR